MKRFRTRALLLGICVLTIHAAAAQVPDALPPGWLKTGAAPDEYAATVDRAVYRSGHASGQLRSRVPIASSTGTLTQRVRADAFKGKRIRLSAWLRTRDVESVLLFVRVDGPGVTVDFANTEDKPLTGTADWLQRDLVVDVPDDALGVTFGIVLQGTGTVWIDDVALGIVTPNTPRTGVAPPRESASAEMERMLRQRYAAEPASPRNLDFEEIAK